MMIAALYARKSTEQNDHARALGVPVAELLK